MVVFPPDSFFNILLRKASKPPQLPEDGGMPRVAYVHTIRKLYFNMHCWRRK